MRNLNPKPLDIAFWAIKLLHFDNFTSDDEAEFFNAFLRAYRASALFLSEFKTLEKTSCPKLYDQPR
jgi:hypothetical protein